MDISSLDLNTLWVAVAAYGAKANQKLLLEIYGDIKKAGVEKVTNTIGNVLEVALSPINLWSEKKKNTTSISS